MRRSIIPPNTSTLIHLLILLGLAFLILHCGGSASPGSEAKAEPPAEDARTLVFKLDTLSRQSPHCQTDSSNCAKVSLVFPHAERGPTSACVAFNRLQLKYMKSALEDVNGGEEKGENLEAIMDQFLQEYQELQAEDLPFSMPWSLETEGQVLYQNDKLVSVQLHQYSYMGGAHPNTFTKVWMFNKTTKNALILQDLNPEMDTLMAIAELAFRQAAEIPAGQSLAEAGFFEGGTFILPQNYALIEEGLLLYYNTYEIAPYVFGPTEVIIPWADLQVAFETDQWL